MTIAQLQVLAEAAERYDEFGSQAEVDLLNAISPAIILRLCGMASQSRAEIKDWLISYDLPEQLEKEMTALLAKLEGELP